MEEREKENIRKITASPSSHRIWSPDRPGAVAPDRLAPSQWQAGAGWLCPKGSTVTNGNSPQWPRATVETATYPPSALRRGTVTLPPAELMTLMQGRWRRFGWPSAARCAPGGAGQKHLGHTPEGLAKRIYIEMRRIHRRGEKKKITSRRLAGTRVLDCWRSLVM